MLSPNQHAPDLYAEQLLYDEFTRPFPARVLTLQAIRLCVHGRVWLHETNHQEEEFSFHKVDKIVSGSFYKTLNVTQFYFQKFVNILSHK